MNVSVVVPLNHDDAERDRNWAWLRERYERLYPDWELVEHPDPGEGAWCKGRAVNAGVRAASGDVLVLADADVLIAEGALRDAADIVAAQAAPWVVPHGSVYRLSKSKTRELLAGILYPKPVRLPRNVLARRPYTGPAGGGLVVVTRTAFEAVGGIDERFLGWGGEDVSLACALDVLVGEHVRVGSPLWHLWHPPQARPGGRAPVANDTLSKRYKEAAIAGANAMRELVAEGAAL